MHFWTKRDGPVRSSEVRPSSVRPWSLSLSICSSVRETGMQQTRTEAHPLWKAGQVLKGQDPLSSSLGNKP